MSNKPKIGDLKRKIVEIPIETKLTDAQLVERGKAHAVALNTLDRMDVEHKAIRDGMKLDRANAEDRERKLRQVIESGSEPLPTKVWFDTDYKKGIVYTKRVDNDEVVAERGLTDGERQKNFDDLARKGVLATGPDGKPIRGTPEQTAQFEKVKDALEQIENANAKDLEPGEGVRAPPDALADGD